MTDKIDPAAGIDVGDIVAYRQPGDLSPSTRWWYGDQQPVPGDTGEVISRQASVGGGPAHIVIRRWRDGAVFVAMEDDLGLVARKPREGAA